MKTIDDYNRISRKAGVTAHIIKIKTTWEKTGIECNCGCKGGEFLELEPQYNINRSLRSRIKCSKTSKEGYWNLDGSAMSLIRSVEWDK